MQKIRFGTIHADYLTMAESIDQIVQLAKDRQGGYVVTPNVDHIVLAESHSGLRDSYAGAALSLADGKPLIWMSRLAGFPLPEKVSGSDLVRPLLARAATEGLKVYFLGAAPGVGAAAARILMAEISGLRIVGTDAPPLGFEKDPVQEQETLRKMLADEPDIVLLALGAPKQELLMHRWKEQGVKPIMLGIGASLDFIAGKVKRSPKWMSNVGLEWLYRLASDPKRLAKRYLVQDIAIIPIFLRLLRTPKGQRVSNSASFAGKI